MHRISGLYFERKYYHSIIASNISYRPAPSSARNNILSRRPQVLLRQRIGSRGLDVPFFALATIDLSIRCSFVRGKTANNSVELLFANQRDNYLGRREGRKLIVLGKIKRQFRGSSPTASCTRSFKRREIYLRSGPWAYDPSGRDLSFSGGALTLLSAPWVNGGVVIVQNSKNECFGFRECAECHFPALLLEPSIVFLSDFPLHHDDPLLLLTRHCLRGSCSSVLPRIAVEEKRNRSRRRIENVISVSCR